MNKLKLSTIRLRVLTTFRKNIELGNMNRPVVIIGVIAIDNYTK